MKYHTVIITSGISLFSYNNIFGKITRDEKLFEFDKSNPKLLEGKDREQAVQVWIKTMNRHIEKMNKKPLNVSAEYSIVYRLEQENLLDKSPKIILFHSDTLGGIAASKLLKDIFNKRFQAEVKLIEIPDLDVSNRLNLNRSLGIFMGKLKDALLEGDKNTTFFAPIGGYKVMTSFAYIVGSYFGYPTGYLHEDKPILQIIPAVPIKIDKQLLEQSKSIIRRIIREGAIDKNNLNYEDKQRIEQLGALFEKDQDLVSLNPFGLFICEQKEFAYLFKTQIYISESVRQQIYHNEDLKEFFFQQTEELLKKIIDHKENKGNNFNTLFHESTFKSLKNEKLEFHLYKGASNGRNIVYRVAWKYNEEEDELYINYLWTDHKRYENEAASGNMLREEKGNIENISKDFYAAR